MIEDIITTIKAQLYERAVSPLMGSFIFSWLVWNYKLIILFFSDEDFIEKYRIINEILYASPQDLMLLSFIYPLVTAALYLFAYPYPAKYTYQFSRNRQKEISDIKRKVEEETLLTVKESQSLRREINSLEEEYQKLFSKKDSEIEFIKAENLRLQSENISNKKSISEKKLNHSEISENNLNKMQENILLEISKKNDSIREADMLQLLGENITESRYYLGELQSRGYIEMNIKTGSGPRYELTHHGRAYLVRNKLL